MLGLCPKVTVHCLFIRSGASPKKQLQWPFHLELVLEIKSEVTKLIQLGFIYEVKYLI